MGIRGLKKWALMLTFWVALQCKWVRASDLSGGNLTLTGTADIQGNTISLGTSSGSNAGWQGTYTDGTTSYVDFMGTRSANIWRWWQSAAGTAQLQLTLDNNNTVTLYDQSATPVAKIILNPLGASSIANSLAISGSLTVNGTDNQMPNQTLTGANSVLTEGLADARYLSITGSLVTIGSAIGLSGTMGSTMGLNGGTASTHGYAFAEGLGSTATGTLSIAMGEKALASGAESTAIGEVTTASGANSTAIGLFSSATASQSVAIGTLDTASGNGAVAIGDGNHATGISSLALGVDTTASGLRATSMGYVSKASGDFSTASGYETTASGSFSVSMGAHSTASGNTSTAMGSSWGSGDDSTAMGRSTASGTLSTAMGSSTASGTLSTAMGSSIASGTLSTAMGSSTASGNYSAALGYQVTASSYGEVVIGMYNSGGYPSLGNPYGIPNTTGGINVESTSGTTWVGTDPIFEIGNGTLGTASSYVQGTPVYYIPGYASASPDPESSFSYYVAPNTPPSNSPYGSYWNQGYESLDIPTSGISYWLDFYYGGYYVSAVPTVYSDAFVVYKDGDAAVLGNLTAAGLSTSGVSTMGAITAAHISSTGISSSGVITAAPGGDIPMFTGH